MNSISIDLKQFPEAAEKVAAMNPGDKCELTLEVQVDHQDGEELRGTVVSIPSGKKEEKYEKMEGEKKPSMRSPAIMIIGAGE